MPRSPAYQGLRSRHELLATRVMSSDEFLRTTEAYGPNGFVHPRESLSPIAVVLRPHESADEYECSFQEWLERQEVTISMLQSDPGEERRLRQCFVYSRVRGSASEVWTSGTAGCKRRRVTVESDIKVEECEHERLWSQFGRDLARQMMEMEGRMHVQLLEIKQEMRNLRRGEEETATRLSGNGESKIRTGLMENGAAVMPNSGDISNISVKSEEVDQPVCNAKIFKTASELMSKAMQLKSDAALERLAKAYTRLNEKVTQTEANLQDFEDVDSERILTQDENQISVDEGQRDAALASLVAYEWRGRQYELYQAFDQPDYAEEESSMHQKLVATYEETELIKTEMQTLQVKLGNRLNWLKGVNHGDAGWNAQFHELLEIANALSAEFVLMARVQDQRRMLCVKMLQSNDAIRTQVIRLLDSAHN
ncbi:hypothetical protein PR003_g6899 [Phytophthora rubi]|uniref:Uncharacterized protein n=1 Tax=Phytophthora rubi TaxID=129364 RepID=A0A6A3NEW9_9STRA|nr:hypothetical protein PR002_g5799 [Phytophthora rubi]KAE9347478.1 hypothetical protein PR003_g6899 [Phytophthora rubi]